MLFESAMTRPWYSTKCKIEPFWRILCGMKYIENRGEPIYEGEDMKTETTWERSFLPNFFYKLDLSTLAEGRRHWM